MTQPAQVDFEMHRDMPATLQAAEEFIGDFHNRIQSLLDRVSCFAAELLVREALTNAVVHGCHADPTKEVHCDLRLRGGRLLIAVRDDGDGFDWRVASANRANLPDCSGRGMEILRKYASRVRFNGVGNAVAIIKRFNRGKNTMIQVTQEDNKTVVRPAGDSIVAACIPELRSKMQGIVAEGARELVVDLVDVRMVDSSGIGLLISAFNSLRKVGGRFAVIHASAEILDLFHTMRMHQHFSVSGD